jgi:radical SAM superfamily enzyme YgiQ (UPF0313 family)
MHTKKIASTNLSRTCKTRNPWNTARSSADKVAVRPANGFEGELRGDLIEHAAEAGLRSIFVGFETLTPENLESCNQRQNLGRDYKSVADRLHALGIMINGSFVFGMDDDDQDVFRRTLEWAIEHGITTATFHVQMPYPGTQLHARTVREGRMFDARLESL